MKALQTSDSLGQRRWGCYLGYLSSLIPINSVRLIVDEHDVACSFACCFIRMFHNFRGSAFVI